VTWAGSAMFTGARIGDVGVHDGLVARQPVIVGARGLERRVEHGQVQRLVQVQRRFEQVDRRSPGQHHAVDVGAVVKQVLLYGERPHAVPEQDERQVRMVRADLGREQADVVHQGVPAALAQVPVGIRVGAGAVTAVILGVDDETIVVQGLRDVIVALGVLAHPVGQLDRGPRPAVVLRLPLVGDDLRAVGRLVTEFAQWHRGVLSPRTRAPDTSGSVAASSRGTIRVKKLC
jgi:hypothetical protein